MSTTTDSAATAATTAAGTAATTANLTLDIATKNWADFKKAREALGPFQDPDFVNKVLMKNLAFAAVALASLFVFLFQDGKIFRLIALSILVCTAGIIGVNVYAYQKDTELKKLFKDKNIEEIKKQFPDVVPPNFENIYSPL